MTDLRQRPGDRISLAVLRDLLEILLWRNNEIAREDERNHEARGPL